MVARSAFITEGASRISSSTNELMLVSLLMRIPILKGGISFQIGAERSDRSLVANRPLFHPKGFLQEGYVNVNGYCLDQLIHRDLALQ